MSESVAGKAGDLVLKQLNERTEPEPDGVQNSHSNVWTSRQRLRSDAAKSHVGYSKQDLPGVLAALEKDGEIISFHGLLAPATDVHLRAIIENEAEANVQRSVLIGRCNGLLSPPDGDDDE